MHYLKYESREAQLYDVTLKKHTKQILSREIPSFCRTIAMDDHTIFIIGGYLKGYQSLTWEYKTAENKINVKKEMN